MTKFLMVIFCLSVFSAPTFGAEASLFGKIYDISANAAGVMVRMDTGVPGNCAGSPYGWMLIKQEHVAITSVVLSAWALGKTSGTVYTSAPNGSGFCLVNQFDPKE